jgi:thiol-disulfide isomerase/thioredoxin
MRRSIAGLAVAGLLLAGSLASAWVPTVSTVTPREAARQIVRAQGRVRVVLIYSVTCPYCRALFPDFVDLAEREHRRGVTVLTFSTDDDSKVVAEFLGDKRLPFSTARIDDNRPGAFDAALKSTGIELGARVHVPFVAVLDRDGTVVGQRTGADSLEQVEDWLDDLE